MSRLPVTLLGGYLGAGKTTLLNRLLTEACGLRWIVLVNDFGEIAVDAALVAEHDGDTLALANGCVCCAIADDLGPALEHVRRLAAGPNPPDHVVMELSGVAEPARVAPWADTTGFRLDGVVVCADAEQIVELADRRFVGDTIRTQLASADIVLLTKCDLAAEAGKAARAFIAGVTDAPIVDARDVEIASLLSVDGSHVAAVDLDVAGDPSRGHLTSTIDVADPSSAGLERLVDGLPADVIRAKGIIRCTDRDHPLEVHLVGARREIRERPDLRMDAATDVLVVIRADASGDVDG